MKLSYVIPTYNAASFVQATLDNIYAISLPEKDYEVIVVDDCSTDNTCEVIEQYAQNHSNICLIRQPKNHRQGAARNRGLEVAKGEYITFVDSDDIILDGIVTALKCTQKNKVDLTYCSCYHEKTPTEFVLKEIDLLYISHASRSSHSCSFHFLTSAATFFASPVATFIRKLKHQ